MSTGDSSNMSFEQVEMKIISTKNGGIRLHDLTQFQLMMEKIPVENKNLYRHQWSFIFVEMLKRFDVSEISENSEIEMSNQIISTLKRTIEFISTMIGIKDESNQSSDVLLFFLHRLKNKLFKEISADLYKKLSDVINDVSWVFALKENDVNVFPVHELIVKVVGNFRYDKENLMYLTMALQTFKEVDEQFKDSESEKCIRNIAKNHNIGILECMIDGGRLIENSELNYQHNLTLIAKNEKYIIIRNQLKSYFSKYDKESIVAEVDDSKEEKCYFIKIMIQPEWGVISFESFMERAPLCEKKKFLSAIFQNNTYNFFYDNSILIYKDTHGFISLVNQADCDKKICLKDNIYENSFEGFYDIIMQNRISDVRASILYGDDQSCDVVTLDFIVVLYKSLKLYEFQYNVFENKYTNDTLTYQNQIIKSFFDYLIEHEDTETFFRVYEDYYNFVKEHFSFGDTDKIGKVLHLVLPFSPYQPFKNIDEAINWVIHKNEYPSDYVIEKITMTKFRNREQILLQDESDITAYRCENSAVSKLKSNSYVIINHKSRTFETDDSMNHAFNIISKLDQFNELFLDNDVSYCDNQMKETVKLMQGTGIHHKNYKQFHSRSTNAKYVVCVFKLLWHFASYSISGGKIQKFYKLVLEKHHTDSILKQEDWKEFFESVSEMLNQEKGTLVIAKESSGDGGTLAKQYNKYAEEFLSGERGELHKIFDVSFLQSEIVLKNEKYTYRGAEINKIVFVTDNVTKGSATKQLLNYHLVKGQDTSNKKFLCFPDDKKIKMIVERNVIANENIQIYSLYCLESTKEICLGEDAIYQINALRKISSQYIANDEVLELYAEIYGAGDGNSNKGSICMIRCNNMPYRAIFDAKVVDTTNIVGLFHRKNEQS